MTDTVKPFPADRVRQMLDAVPVEREKPAKSRLALTWFSDVDAALDVPELVEGLLALGQFSVVYGESNSGKTFFASDLALHIAMGWEWRGRRVDRGAVLYIAAEGGHGVRNRIAAFRQQHKISGRVPFALIPVAVDVMNADGDTAEVIDLIEEAARQSGVPVRLIVLDTLARVMAGGDENSGQDMGRLIGNVDRIRERTGAHVLVVHHSGKDATKGARGHSSLRAAVDTEIAVKKDAGTGVACAEVVKQRDMECAGEFSFTLERVELGTNQYGKPVTSCVVKPAEAAATTRRKRLTDEQKAFYDGLLRVVMDHGQKVVPERDASPVTAVTTDVAIEGLCALGVLDRNQPRSTLRGRFHSFKTKLKGKEYLGCTESYVWLLDAPVTGVTARDQSVTSNARRP